MNPVSKPYSEFLERGIFALPYCRNCSSFHFYPRATCPFCLSEEVKWREASGRGTILAVSIVQRAPSESFAKDVPYVIAIVRTLEGPHMMSRIIDCVPTEVCIGQNVSVAIRNVADKRLMPVFQVA